MRFCYHSALIVLFAIALTALAQPPQPPPATGKGPVPLPAPQPPEPTAETKAGGKNLDEWIQDLRHPSDPGMRVMALQTVPGYGKVAAKAAPLVSQAGGQRPRYQRARSRGHGAGDYPVCRQETAR